MNPEKTWMPHLQVKISFSGNYVIDAAKALRGDNITINFSGDMRPFVLKDEDDETVLQLVLPLRTYN